MHSLEHTVIRQRRRQFLSRSTERDQRQFMMLGQFACEAMNPQRELYGLDRLCREISTPGNSVVDLGQRILDSVSQFVSGYPQSDDMCLVCFGRVEEK